LAKDPISELPNATKELKAINKEVTLLEAGLKRVLGLTSKATKSITGIFSSSTGQSTGMGLGVSNAQFGAAGSTGGVSLMPWAYTKGGTAAVAGAQGVLGLAGAAYSALPGLSTVVPRATGFYQATTMLPGTTRAGLTASTMQNMRGGITGPNEDVAATNILANSFGLMGGNLARGQQEVRGAALGLAIPNATAASAIGSMHTGEFSGGMYQYGISTLDVKTGQTRPTQEIAQQIYQRVMGNKKLTPAQLEFSMREGSLNRFLNDTTSKEQQALLRPMIQQIALGGNGNLLTGTGANNPLTDTLYKQTTSDMSLANRATDPMLKGYATTTSLLVSLNASLEGLPDKFFQLKGSIDALTMSKPGSAVSGVVGTAVTVAGTIGTGMVVRSVFKKMAASAATKAAATAAAGGATAAGATAIEQGAVQTAGKVATKVGFGVLGKAIPVVGGAYAGATGQGFWSTVGTSALIAGGIAGVATGGAAALPAALVAGGLTALGWLGAKALKSMTSTAQTAVAAGQQTSGVGQGNFSLPANADPNLVQTLTSAGFTGQSLVTAYGVARAESGGNATSYNGKGLDKSYGLFQINMENNDPRNPNMGTKRNAAYLKKYGSIGYKGPQSLYDPAINSKIAYDMSKGGTNFQPWTTYTKGTYANQLTPGANGGQTVNINLKIDKASEAEAVALAKRVKDILTKDKSLQAMGTK
jgi:hypothetical protein